MLRDEVTRAIDKGHNYNNSAVTLVTGKCKARHVVCDHPCFKVEPLTLYFIDTSLDASVVDDY